MPQPLSKLFSTAVEVKWGASSVRNHRDLAALALEIIGTASYGEGNFARLVATFNHGRSKPVLDYYLSLKNDGPKAAVVEALAASVLTPERLVLFRAVAKIHQRALTARQPIAHWVWGECSKLSDALIIIDPRDLLANLALLDPITNKAKAAYRADDLAALKSAIAESDIARSDIAAKVMVYREKDFLDIIRDLNRAIDLVNQFHNVHQWDLVNLEMGDEEARQLSQQPEIQSLIEALHQSQKPSSKDTP